MFEDISRTFDTVIARDLWLWNHENAPLLSWSDKEDRLLLLPDHNAKTPYGDDWISYGYEIAEKLEEQQRWSEAQAYWFASAYLLAQCGKISTEGFTKAIIGVISTAERSTGMSISEDNPDLGYLIESGTLSLSVPTREAIVLSLLIIGMVQPLIYEEISSPKLEKFVLKS